MAEKKTKIDIFSGFLGAGKTTLIKKLIKEAFAGEQIVLIENEFGEIGIDGGFMREAGIQVNELNSGCICCSLVGDFGKALEKVMDDDLTTDDDDDEETGELGAAAAAAVEQVQQMAAAMQGEIVQMQAAMQQALMKGDMAEYMRLAQEFQQKMMEQALGQQK